MLIREWMTTRVISVTEDQSIMKASRLMRDNDIHRLPVVDGNGKVIGIVSDRDVKAASPSKATTLDVHELYYLLSELKIKDIMTRNPVCLKPDDSIEQAALEMIERNIGGMPVVDDFGILQGIVTDSDIFKVLINISGASTPGLQLAFELPAASGSLKPILNYLKEQGADVVSVLNVQSEHNQALRRVYVRIRRLEPAREKELLAAMKEQFGLLHWTKSGK